MVEHSVSNYKDTKKSRLPQHITIENLHSEPQNRHAPRRLVGVGHVGQSMWGTSTQRLWKRDKGGFEGKEEEEATLPLDSKKMNNGIEVLWAIECLCT